MEILMLVIGLLGLAGLIAFRPLLEVSPSNPIDPRQPFSVPFKITNTGLLAIRDVTIYCYIHRVEVGPLMVTNCVVGQPDWNINKLDRGESKTIICRLVQAPTMPSDADIAIVVDHKAFGVPFKVLRRVFRFIGQYGATWQWLPQPSADIQSSVRVYVPYQPFRPRKPPFR